MKYAHINLCGSEHWLYLVPLGTGFGFGLGLIWFDLFCICGTFGMDYYVFITCTCGSERGKVVRLVRFALFGQYCVCGTARSRAFHLNGCMC